MDSVAETTSGAPELTARWTKERVVKVARARMKVAREADPKTVRTLADTLALLKTLLTESGWDYGELLDALVEDVNVRLKAEKWPS